MKKMKIMEQRNTDKEENNSEPYLVLQEPHLQVQTSIIFETSLSIPLRSWKVRKNYEI